MGMITGYTNYLESATTINPDRPNGFPFREWHPHLVEKLLEVALSALRIDALKWVTRQQDWQSIVSEDLVEKINLFIKEYTQARLPLEDSDRQ
jgi:hypothetical protein